MNPKLSIRKRRGIGNSYRIECPADTIGFPVICCELPLPNFSGRLRGKKCIVAGEGYEVAAKVRGLAEASADVLYLNRQAVPEIAEMVASGVIRWEARDFVPKIWTDVFWWLHAARITLRSFGWQKSEKCFAIPSMTQRIAATATAQFIVRAI
jgi:hypothetical protein